jgi:hypothetical protein
MDFGLARRSAADDPRLTASGLLVGTPAYLAPERVGGESGLVNPAGDIYSLGVMLYEMLTGRLPFEGPLPDLLRQALTRDPERPSSLRPDLDPRLEAICLKALAKDPKERFPDMGSFALALEACRAADGGPSTLEMARAGAARTRRRRAVALGGAGAVLLLALLAGLLLIGRDQPPADPLRSGSHWMGSFRFRPRGIPHGDAVLAISERNGDWFSGTYTSEGGRYRWLIQGTTHNGKIRWEFTQWVRGDGGSSGLVGKGRVDGTVAGDTMTVVFRDPRDGSVADVRLNLQH